MRNSGGKDPISEGVVPPERRDAETDAARDGMD
jgi:hypothetical protein